MALTLNAGTGGADLATEAISSEHYQLIKLIDGTGAATTVVAAGGGVEANALRVTVANDSTGLLSVDDNGGALTVDWNGTAPPIGAGVEATALRVTLATDSTGLVSIDDGGGNISVDWGGTTPPIGAGTEAAALRVTLATDSTGVVSIDDNSGSITVDGTVTANPASGTIDTVTTVTTLTSITNDVNIADGGNAITVDWAGTAPPIGAGTEAAALRVTLATDSTGVVSIDDNSGSLTVDNGGTFAVQSTLQSNSGVDIGDVDILSVIPGTGATNLGKAEDAVHASADVGVMGLAVRTDTPANKSGTNGDYEPLQVSAGRLWTSSTVTSTIPGVGATNLGKAEDAVHASGDTGVMALAVRTDTLAALAGTTGDYAPLQVSSLGALQVNIVPSTTNGLSIFRSLDIDETEEEVKATAGQVYHISAFNSTAAPLFLKFYNATAAVVVVGTTVPVLTYLVPGNADSDGAGFVIDIPQGIAFGTAITVAATTAVADADTGAPGANACMVNVLYK